MPDPLLPFLLHWTITALSLWAASHVFRGIHFADPRALIISALLLGFANAVVRPLLVVLTFPLTLLTLGFFLLVINALMLLLVAALVRGFTISGFWTAFFASVFISVMSFAIGLFVDHDTPVWQSEGKGLWVDSAQPLRATKALPNIPAGVALPAYLVYSAHRQRPDSSMFPFAPA